MPVSVKICGLRTEAEIDAASQAGARYIGLVFFEKSPRYISRDAARVLAQYTPPGLAKVALVVNPDDGFLDSLTEDVPLDMLQLHGAETPERVAAIKARYGLPVMKAVGVADAEDLPKIASYESVADQLLIDAKPPKDADLPGGNGLSFDWRLIADRTWKTPWMLAGGLTPETAGIAIKATGATQLDVSSGVESAPGLKDPALIDAFVKAAQAA